MKEFIKVQNIKKIYNETTNCPVVALDDVSFTMEQGEFVCVMGPSGAGKSTFINCISTIDRPSSGNVWIDGISIHDLGVDGIGEFRYKNIGFVFQDVNLLDYLTMFDNIAIPLTLFNEKDEDIKNRVEELSKQLGIFDLLHKFPFECSGGQKQRAAIARALVGKPQLIVADEPTGNLDSKNSHEILEMLMQLNEEGISIIMVTHDPIIASYSSKLLYIQDGKIDKILDRDSLSQTEYFYEIVNINSEESLSILNKNA